MDTYSSDDIVISGIDGIFPKSKNIEEFGQNLYNKIDLLTEEEIRWTHSDYPMLPKRKYLIDGLEKFDSDLFKIHPKQADAMDPQVRILLEKAYSAILDAGISPAAMRGSNTGVFAATCFDDTMGEIFAKPNHTNPYTITGCQPVFFSNRLSHTLDLKGPSFTLDSACSSAMYALLQAVNAMRLNQCDAALVCGANLILNANLMTHMMPVGILSPDGICHSFDSRANGYVRADAISVLFLQKRKDAKRIYADVVHVLGNNDGYKIDGICSPSADMQCKLFNQICNEMNIDPSTVDYIETHATGTVVGDLVEATAIDHAYCTNRKDALLIGALKANMGHSEGASALAAIAKVIHSFETGLIPPTINLQQLRPDIAGFHEGRLKVCTETTPLPGPLVAVNSFGFGGANAHILLRQWKKTKTQQSIDEMPRIVFWSGRTERAVSEVIQKIKSIPVDPEFIGLLYNIQKTPMPENIHRGFGVFEDTGPNTPPLCLAEDIVRTENVQRPIVWLFPGLGSQWTAMGKSLMQIQKFRKSIFKCHNILKNNFDFDLINVITSDDKAILESLYNSIVAIGAIQIALADVLKSLEIPMDFIIGHSAGEMVCAYADGAITLEQCILSAYYKGKVSAEGKTIVGAMAAVGMSYVEIKDRIPSGVYVACHNSCRSCTISGPKETVLQFIEQLKSENIFAKVIPTSNIPFHSHYIADWGKTYIKHLRAIMPKPTKRSSKWISSSIHPDDWQTNFAQYSSAEYHGNNYTSTVHFEEACSAIPKNSIIIEIAPHALMQPILRHTFSDAILIPLTQRNNPNNAAYFMTAIGKLYVNGVNMQIDRLYREIEFPVSRGTPMISPLIEYDHEKNWNVPNLNAKTSVSFERKVTIDLSAEDEYLIGHVINDRCLMPGTTYMYLVWETLTQMSSEPDISSFNVEFTNIQYHRATVLTRDSRVSLSILIHTNGNFELTEERSLVVSGCIKRIPNEISASKLIVNPIDENSLVMTKKDIYKEIQLRGYKYTKTFKALNSFCCNDNTGRVQWHGRWDSFMDAMVHILLISKNTRMLHLPTKIDRVKINAVAHTNHLAALKDRKKQLFDVIYCEERNKLLSEGIEMSGITFKALERENPDEPEILQSYEFVPLVDTNTVYSLSDATSICLNFVVEKSLPNQIKIMEFLGESDEPLIEHFRQHVLVTPRLNASYKLCTNRDIQLDSIQIERLTTQDQTKYTIVIVNGIDANISSMADKVSSQGFLIVVRDRRISSSLCALNSMSMTLVSALQSEDLSFSLFQHNKPSSPPEYKVIFVDSDGFSWVKVVQQSKDTDNVVLVSVCDKTCGLLGFLNTLRCEIFDAKYQCVIIDDESAPPFDIKSAFYEAQLHLGLPVNIHRNGQWGTFRYLALKQGEPKLSISTPLCIQMQQLGNLQSLKWVPSESHSAEERVQIHFVGLSACDVMSATGNLIEDAFIKQKMKKIDLPGREYSGIGSNDERFMGICVDGGGLATEISVSSNDFIFKVPESMSLQDAASIPTAYLSIYAAFFVGNQINAGQTILIDGSTCTGFAAITIALAYGLEVFVLVSSDDDKYLLLNHFATLKDSNVDTFEHMLLNTTNGLEFDIVLSSSHENRMNEYVQHLCEGGTFFAIEPFDLQRNSHLLNQLFEKEITYRSISLDKLAKKPNVKEYLTEIINRDLEIGVIKPLPVLIFQPNKIETAFRSVSSTSVVKVLIRMPDSNEIANLRVKNKFVANPKSVYIITGGLGGVGLELANWMIMRGVRNLVIASRRRALSPYAQQRINFFRSIGCNVTINTSDITTLSGCEELLKTALKFGPIVGIFNLAAIILDSMLPNQTPELFKKSHAVKALSTAHLDELSRTFCPHLEHFVGFSSISAAKGNAGQTNYATTNAIMDRIIENRVKQNLPGISIHWGPISDVGMAARLTNADCSIELSGFKQQRVDRCLHVLDDLLFAKSAIVCSVVIPHKKIADEESNVFSRVLRLFRVKDFKKIPASTNLYDLGIDSMIISEIKQILEREANISLSPSELKQLTIEKLKNITGAT